MFAGNAKAGGGGGVLNWCWLLRRRYTYQKNKSLCPSRGRGKKEPVHVRIDAIKSKDWSENDYTTQ